MGCGGDDTTASDGARPVTDFNAIPLRGHLRAARCFSACADDRDCPTGFICEDKSGHKICRFKDG